MSFVRVLIFILLYADDIMLMSGTQKGLQMHLHASHTFCCTERDMLVNLGKNQCLVP